LNNETSEDQKIARRARLFLYWFWGFVAILVIPFLIAVILAILIDNGVEIEFTPTPKDAEYIDLFNKNKILFYRLAELNKKECIKHYKLNGSSYYDEVFLLINNIGLKSFSVETIDGSLVSSEDEVRHFGGRTGTDEDKRQWEIFKCRMSIIETRDWIKGPGWRHHQYGYGYLSKSIVFYPIKPREDGDNLIILDSSGRELSREYLYSSLDVLPKRPLAEKDKFCRYRKIEEHWFLSLCPMSKPKSGY
jgi:hypothetical protein